MMNSNKAKIRWGLVLLGLLLLAAMGYRSLSYSPGTASRTEDLRTTGASTSAAPSDRTVVEVSDLETLTSPEVGSVLVSGGESLESVYIVTLSQCLEAGRLTFLDQKIRLTRQERYSSWAALDGRLEDATPVRIKGKDLGEMRTEVLFTVGTQKSDHNKARVRALREGFEKRLLVATPEDP